MAKRPRPKLCSKHPAYQAKFPPRIKCDACQKAYNAKHPTFEQRVDDATAAARAALTPSLPPTLTPEQRIAALEAHVKGIYEWSEGLAKHLTEFKNSVIKAFEATDANFRLVGRALDTHQHPLPFFFTYPPRP